ncbi:hypothetical protein OSTOST_18967, partial [Ostertagia ostertagi]
RDSSSPHHSGDVKEVEKPVSSALPSAWKVTVSPTPSPISSPLLLEESVISSKKRGAGRFTPKGAKFRDASSLLCETERGTHFAPWAGVTTTQQKPDVVPLSEILKKEAETVKQSKSATLPSKQEHDHAQRKRTSTNVSWTETLPSSSPVSSPQKLSLAEIIKEEEHRLKKKVCIRVLVGMWLGWTRRVSRPLHFIEDEERAIEELAQLYRENVGDEVLVRVERCGNFGDVTCSYPPLWANTPHFRI